MWRTEWRIACSVGKLQIRAVAKQKPNHCRTYVKIMGFSIHNSLLQEMHNGRRRVMNCHYQQREEKILGSWPSKTARWQGV
jgi:hypothetical protein